MTKKDLEQKIITMEKENRGLRVDNIFLEKEMKNMAVTLNILGTACHAVYKCYPYVLGECCTEPELIKLFKVQDALDNFLRKLGGLNKPKTEKEKGDEI